MDVVVVKKDSKTTLALLQGVLKENGIDSIVKSKMGEAFVMKAGSLLEEYSLYVRPEDEEKAKELIDAFGR